MTSRSPGYRPTDDELLDLVLPVVAEQGCGAVTMDQIVASGQVTKQTLYAHFGSKDGLLIRLVEREATLMRAIFDDVSMPENIDLNDPAASLSDALKPFFIHAAARPLGMRLLADSTAPHVPGFDQQVLTDAVSRIMSILDLWEPVHDEVETHRRLLLATMSAQAIRSGVLTAISHHIDPEVSVRTCAAYIVAGIVAAYPEST
ncbi:TetR/AcrR family transcriptional regulator [Mycobacteroides salmoniphilum]|uniref:TetR/AcrR family transcriptional regulator n=1 Tax=Mycobacteroides salmoniphilum TaxID=404941 RepID=UPI000992C2DD|nr:TetR/AcrR family transcriptional regulator [Mycobacteroides salmoniphilum]